MVKSGGASNAPCLEVLNKYQLHTFMAPLKKINEGQDVAVFLTSKAYGDIMTFLLQLNRAVFPSYVQTSQPDQKKTVQIWELGSSAVGFSETVKCLRSMFVELNQILDQVPPDTAARRFGNASFRKWYQIVEDRTTNLFHRYLPSSILDFPLEPGGKGIRPVNELQPYFLGSFGSAQRLDYGSGHELSFLAFLGGIWKLGGFDSSNQGNEERGIVLGVIDMYLQLVRRLIKTYTLEPAGSHGVWGLDDHSFIPYIFGSAQYGLPISPEDKTPTEGSIDNAPDPADVAKIVAVNKERDKNMYFGAIGFIHDVKTGPFWEHSPMLYDISGVRAGWGKINKGMIKMYSAEVLSKFPVVQHFPFGSLFSWDHDPNAAPAPMSVHASSQPVREGHTVSLENASARGLPPEGTKALWASKPTALPSPGIGTAAPWARKPTFIPGPGAATAAPWASSSTTLPGASVGAAAPWANMSGAAASSGLLPTRFPQSASRGAHQTVAMPIRAKDGESESQTMPPPTKAPWAK